MALSLSLSLSLLPLTESDEVSSVRQYYQRSKDAAGAATKMPKWRSIEKSLLQGLAKHADKANLLGALNFVSSDDVILASGSA